MSATDGIANGGVNHQVEIRPVGAERIGGAYSQCIATLPPAVLADNNAWIDFFAESCPGTHSAGWRTYVNPIAILDSARCGGRGI